MPSPLHLRSLSRWLLFGLVVSAGMLGTSPVVMAGESLGLEVLIDSVEGLPSSVVRAEVAVDNGAAPLDSWSYGVCHDPAVATAVALTLGPTLAPPAFFDQQIHSLGVTQVVITDFVLANPLPLGRHVLMQIDYQLVGSIGDGSTLSLCNTLPTTGAPPVQVSFTSGSTALPFVESPGALSIVECMTVADLACSSTPAGDVQLTWTPRPEYSAVEVHRNGIVIATLGGDSGAYVDAPTLGRHEYRVQGSCGGGVLLSNLCVGHAVEFSIDDVVATEGEIVTVPVRLDFRGGQLDGFSFGVAHDATRLTPLAAVDSGALAAVRGGQGPDVMLVQMNSLGLSVGMIIASEEPFESLLPFQAGTDEMIELGYQVGFGNLGVTPLTFTDGIGTPPVITEVVIELGTVLPRTQGGSVEILELVVNSPFLRGDINGNGTRELTDIIQLLRVLFLPEEALGMTCEDALDANDDGVLSITDGIAELSYLFGGGAPLPPPLEFCEPDPTADALDCSISPCSAQ